MYPSSGYNLNNPTLPPSPQRRTTNRQSENIKELFQSLLFFVEIPPESLKVDVIFKAINFGTGIPLDIH